MRVPRRRPSARAPARATLSLAVAALLAGGCNLAARERPNVVLIVVDTLRRDRLPGYGRGREAAPRFARLAEQGVLFERAIAHSSWTKTAMASLLTSRNPDRHGVRGVEDVLPDRLTTLAEAFSAAGYRTIGINANPWLQHDHGFASGFDVYESHSFAPARKLNHRALARLAEHGRGPFLLYVHYMDVHAPYLPPAECFSQLPLEMPGAGSMSNEELEKAYRKDGLAGPGVQQRVEALYDAEVRCMDAALGELLDALELKGWLRNTIVMVTADHGEAFREHGTTEHGWNLYPEVYEVPLLVVWPGRLQAGSKVGRQVASSDLGPTLLELAGVAVPDTFEGRSLLPSGGVAPQDHLAICAVGLNDYQPNRDFVAVVSPEHLYIKERRQGDVELYDLREDPGARRNLGGEHPAARPLAALAGASAFERADTRALDEETRRQLEALGYLHGRE